MPKTHQIKKSMRSWYNMASCEAYMHTVAHTSTIKVTVLASASASKIDSKILGIKIGQELSECSFLSVGYVFLLQKLGEGKVFRDTFFAACFYFVVFGCWGSSKWSSKSHTKYKPRTSFFSRPLADQPMNLGLFPSCLVLLGGHPVLNALSALWQAWQEFGWRHLGMKGVFYARCVSNDTWLPDVTCPISGTQSEFMVQRQNTVGWFTTTDILKSRNPTNFHGAFIIAPKISS